MWMTVCWSGGLGDKGGRGAWLWKNVGAEALSVFSFLGESGALKLDQSEKLEELWGSGSGLITSSIRGRPSPARAQLTVASFSLSAEATGPARLDGGKIGPLQLGH